MTLSGEAQGAARGAMADSIEGNTSDRVAATPVVHQGTPAPAEARDAEAALHPYAANDAAAAALGVAVGGFYRNTAGLQQRQA